MRVWLDDIRKMPEGFTHHAKTYDECIALLETGQVEFISFDHDLADAHYHDGNPTYKKYKEKTGYHVANWIERKVHQGKIRCPQWEVHSMNPVGAQNIIKSMRSTENLQRQYDGQSILFTDKE